MINKLRIKFTLLMLVTLASCENFDNRIQIAKDYITSNELKGFPSKLIEFKKTDGEEIEAVDLQGGGGMQKMYKLHYRAVYESLATGFIDVRIKDSSTFPQIFSGDNGVPFISGSPDYHRRKVNVHDTFDITGEVVLKKTENGWKAIRYRII